MCVVLEIDRVPVILADRGNERAVPRTVEANLLDMMGKRCVTK